MNERKLQSKKQEKRVAKETKGRTTPASGAFWSAKADVRSKLFLVECKTTQKDFYSLTEVVWSKIYKEAVKDGMRIPIMCIDLNNGRDVLAVLSTYDLGNFPPPSSYADALLRNKGKPNLSERLRYNEKGTRFILENKKVGIYDLSAIPWKYFLSDVVPYYEEVMLK